MDPTFDFTDARNRMVDSQVRPNKVTDPRIIAAMRRIPARAVPAAAAFARSPISMRTSRSATAAC